ncbi:MAG: hypothetical protein HND47_20535 [Chloroflexi bacterium]|nr:hypothetical protein [Chloroflexota bacterium]
MDITLALGGGGAKGNAHIGVLRRLEQEGFKIRSVAGTSYGGVVAVFYALGCSPNEIQSIFESVDQNHLYGRTPLDGPSLLGMGGVRQLLNRVLGEKTFDDLRIPCAVTAVDINTGGEVTLSEGRLQDAVLATIALPGIFPVHRINGWELVDGGVLNPVPVSVARTLSPRLPVVAVVPQRPNGKTRPQLRPACAGNFPTPHRRAHRADLPRAVARYLPAFGGCQQTAPSRTSASNWTSRTLSSDRISNTSACSIKSSSRMWRNWANRRWRKCCRN